MKVDTHKHTPAEVCAEFGICKQTLIRWAKNPEFPQPLRLTSRIVRYDLEAIKRHLSEKGG